jgi:hypothetical protein
MNVSTAPNNPRTQSPATPSPQWRRLGRSWREQWRPAHLNSTAGSNSARGVLSKNHQAARPCRRNLHHTASGGARLEVCHRQVRSEVRHHVEARIRRREFVFRDVIGGVHRWRDAAPTLRAESTVILGRHTPIAGQPPTVDLVVGYSRSNTSPLLKRFLARWTNW